MKNKKKWLIALKMIVFVLLFVLLSEGLGMLVYPKTGDTTPKMVFYRQREEAPDIMLLGTSAVFRGVVPLKLEEITGLDVVDMSTPGQTTLSSLTLLKDSIGQGKIPDTVVMYTNIRRFVRAGHDEWDYQVMANLPLGLDKLYMLVRGFEVEEWPEAMFRAVRGRENFSLSQMKAILEDEVEFSSYANLAPEEIRPYIGEGHAYNNAAQDPASINLPAGAIDNFSLDKANREYYDQIVALCRKHDIELIVFCIPRLPATIIAAGDYDGFHKYVTEITAADGVAFWDLTYVRPELLDVRPENFQDGYHGNTAFAMSFTELLGEMINKHLDGTLVLSDYVYDDYATFLQIHKGINAVFIKDKLYNNDTERQYMDVQLVLGADTTAEFCVHVAPEGSEEYVLFRDWGTEKRVVFGGALKPGTYSVKVQARQTGGETEQTIVKTFTIK